MALEDLYQPISFPCYDCCPGDLLPCIYDCGLCDVMSGVWKFTFPAATVGDGCSEVGCAALAGVYLLYHVGGCKFETVERNPCSTGDPLGTLELVTVLGDLYWRLTVAGEAVYEIAASSFGCFGKNAMTKVSAPGFSICEHSSYPDQVTVSSMTICPKVVPCCGAEELPTLLWLDILGTSIGLHYTTDPPDVPKWIGSGTVCGVSITVKFYCYDNPSWALEVKGLRDGGAISSSTDPVKSCSPLYWPNASIAGNLTADPSFPCYDPAGIPVSISE